MPPSQPVVPRVDMALAAMVPAPTPATPNPIAPSAAVATTGAATTVVAPAIAAHSRPLGKDGGM